MLVILGSLPQSQLIPDYPQRFLSITRLIRTIKNIEPEKGREILVPFELWHPRDRTLELQKAVIKLKEEYSPKLKLLIATNFIHKVRAIEENLMPLKEVKKLKHPALEDYLFLSIFNKKFFDLILAAIIKAREIGSVILEEPIVPQEYYHRYEEIDRLKSLSDGFYSLRPGTQLLSNGLLRPKVRYKNVFIEVVYPPCIVVNGPTYKKLDNILEYKFGRQLSSHEYISIYSFTTADSGDAKLIHKAFHNECALFGYSCVQKVMDYHDFNIAPEIKVRKAIPFAEIGVVINKSIFQDPYAFRVFYGTIQTLSANLIPFKIINSELQRDFEDPDLLLYILPGLRIITDEEIKRLVSLTLKGKKTILLGKVGELSKGQFAKKIYELSVKKRRNKGFLSFRNMTLIPVAPTISDYDGRFSLHVTKINPESLELLEAMRSVQKALKLRIFSSSRFLHIESFRDLDGAFIINIYNYAWLNIIPKIARFNIFDPSTYKIRVVDKIKQLNIYTKESPKRIIKLAGEFTLSIRKELNTTCIKVNLIKPFASLKLKFK